MFCVILRTFHQCLRLTQLTQMEILNRFSTLGVWVLLYLCEDMVLLFSSTTLYWITRIYLQSQLPMDGHLRVVILGLSIVLACCLGLVICFLYNFCNLPALPYSGNKTKVIIFKVILSSTSFLLPIRHNNNNN